MKVQKELKSWLTEFKEVASYHSGDYKNGMNHVLQGLESQIPWFKQIEKEELKEFVNFVNKNIWEKPKNTMEQHLEDFINKH